MTSTDDRLDLPVTRQIMTPNATYCLTTTTAVHAARTMNDQSIGAVPVCDSDGRLCGMITDRDLAIKVVAAGRSAESVQLGELIGDTELITIGADDTVDEAIRSMKQHAVRRLPVMDGADLVGIVSQADIARAMPDTTIGDLVDAISSAPPNG